ncbi:MULTISPECIES: SDR family NAD(P)-dependent oxidoreductase [unclassified Streptomyces]|uniref:SDR family NAD(P)-dependent oxidoreductase n=1 Tax=unclassified Streptomyces TaxID=2593676 RepID=UPI000F71B1F1|nr:MULTISPECIES: SDR family NAD(P)-dependent oxidoreductase [unclassified Streptomyces]AZM64204.1 short-chain dehydrogenase [Streptomyces sp. WAC 01438]RSM93486.1 short-chain dehydrogenase [Streptomyces sp. WAC 01420]
MKTEKTESVRTIVLTGISRGIGHEAATSLIRRRPWDHYVLLARGDAEGLAESFAAATGGTHITGVDCDLSSLADITRAATDIVNRLDAGHLPPLGGYLGNAGLVCTTADKHTADGYELTFGVNVLAHYALARHLMRRFTAPAWIVLTTSDCHFGQFRYTLGATPPPRWEAPQRLATPRGDGLQGGARAYATSKLATVYLTHALARRLPPGVDVFSYNPALVAGTGFFRHSPAPLRALLNGFFRLQVAVGRGMTPQRAGLLLTETILAGPAASTGSYLDRGSPVPSSPESYDEDREEELWHEAARLVGLSDDLPEASRAQA